MDVWRAFDALDALPAELLGNGLPAGAHEALGEGGGDGDAGREAGDAVGGADARGAVLHAEGGDAEALDASSVAYATAWREGVSCGGVGGGGSALLN